MTQTKSVLLLHTDKSQYYYGENVTITLFAKLDGSVLPNALIQLFVFRPDGKRVLRTKIKTDDCGVAVAVYRLQKKDFQGCYYIEAHGGYDTMALSSFLVM